MSKIKNGGLDQIDQYGKAQALMGSVVKGLKRIFYDYGCLLIIFVRKINLKFITALLVKEFQLMGGLCISPQLVECAAFIGVFCLKIYLVNCCSAIEKKLVRI